MLSMRSWQSINSMVLTHRLCELFASGTWVLLLLGRTVNWFGVVQKQDLVKVANCCQLEDCVVKFRHCTSPEKFLHSSVHLLPTSRSQPFNLPYIIFSSITVYRRLSGRMSM